MTLTTKWVYSMSMREIYFPSANGKHTICGWAYAPLGKPKGVVQLIHGYGEHSRRYMHMIGKLLDAGFVVYADDHLGHGKTGHDSGTMGDPHSGGYMTYVKDEKQLHDIAAGEYPDIPYFIFGHSWGSSLARAYAAHYGADLAGLMLCGVCSQWKACDVMYADSEFRTAYEADPYQISGDWQGKVFCDMSARAKDPKNSSNWVSNNPDVVADHDNDVFNLKENTLELLWDFVQLYHFVEQPECAGMIPANIPVYLIAGDLDPCGNYGEGLYHVANTLANSGNQVTVKAYSGYRHEIQNEPAIRDEVVEGLISFLDGVLR